LHSSSYFFFFFFFLLLRPPPSSTLFPYTTLFRSLGLAIGTLVGGTLQLVVQLPALRRAGHSFHPDFHWRDPGVRSILRLMGPSVDRKSTRLNSSHLGISYAVFCLKKKKKNKQQYK